MFFWRCAFALFCLSPLRCCFRYALSLLCRYAFAFTPFFCRYSPFEAFLFNSFFLEFSCYVFPAELFNMVVPTWSFLWSGVFHDCHIFGQHPTNFPQRFSLSLLRPCPILSARISYSFRYALVRLSGAYLGILSFRARKSSFNHF